MKRRLSIFRLQDWSFWHYQISGWLVYAIIDLTVNLSRFDARWNVVTSLCLQLLAGFLITLGLRSYYRTVRFQQLGLAPLVLRIVFASFIAAVLSYYCWFFIEWAFFGKKLLTYASSVFRSAQILAIHFPDKVAWSALYFGIKLWQEWSVQRSLADSATETAQTAQLQILRYQLNPQFVFNALSTVRSLIDVDPVSAKRMITDLSEFLRYSLVNRERLMVTMREEFAAIRLFLAIEHRRLEDRLEVSMSIPPEAEQATIPGFSVQPLVEYALRSALEHSPGPVALGIMVRQDGTSVTVTVSNGNGSPAPLHSSAVHLGGNGLQEWEQLESRLINAFQGKATLSRIGDDGTQNYMLSIQ